MTLKPALSLLLIWITVITLLPLTAAPIARAQDDEVRTDESTGLRFRLSEGSEKVEAPTPIPAVTSVPLSEVETAKLLARLPKLQTEPGDTLDFRLREDSLAPPRAGQTIAAAFAPPSTGARPPVYNNVPLEVTRLAPEGEVTLAPTISITFSQPMVAVSSQEEAASNVPVTLSPQPGGKWRWLGTQTLLFQPDAEGGRLPMASNYTVTIPAGTKSALGNTLRAAKTFTFATPPPDQLIETAIDLSSALNNGYGQVFVQVEPVRRPNDGNAPAPEHADRQNRAEAWVQSTDIGLEAFAGQGPARRVGQRGAGKKGRRRKALGGSGTIVASERVTIKGFLHK